jgi:replication-associated recombination protein RarA
LYGPPGSGKIFWANKIAEIIGYQFKEVKKHYLGTSLLTEMKSISVIFLLR